MELNESMPIYPTRFFPISHIHVPNPDFSANTSSLGNEAAFDEAGEQDMNYERKLKRMISNRESARRSRMRKKKQIEELQYQVDQLHSTNRQLSEKLIQLLEGNQQILQENAQLKERVSSLQIIHADLITPLRIEGDVTVNTNGNQLTAEDSIAMIASLPWRIRLCSIQYSGSAVLMHTMLSFYK